MTVWPTELAGTDLGAVVAITAAPPGKPPGGGKGEEFGKSSPMALLVIVLLGIAVVLLIRSMTKHLKKVPASFDQDQQPAAEGEPSADVQSPADETEADTKPEAKSAG